uniref:transposase n=1 Tax=Cephaloticoccus sp. TaxID=1985742 RepID=UPI0040491FA8
MARKLRIQFEGAMYHVINRGNYRRDIFESVGTVQAFEEALIEACENYGWRLHAHVVMRNHYHLALETPRANLVDGMHWLQSTFATRFNRLRQERGHLFQGRYQALLIEDAAALSRVVDYIHLNPVRAEVVAVQHLAGFRWSSLSRYLRGPRPKVFVAKDWLEAKGLQDTPKGINDYLTSLLELATDEAEQKRLGLESLSSGWAIGTDGWRQAIAKDHANKALDPGLESNEIADLKSALWTQTFESEMHRLDKTPADAKSSSLRVQWKLSMAQRLREVGAPYAWIAEHLHMGKPSSVRVYLCQHRAKINK